VLISPFLRPGAVSGNYHYSLLRIIEDIFSPEYLGYAGQPSPLSPGRWTRDRLA
jgi:hypothetical protein